MLFACLKPFSNPLALNWMSRSKPEAMRRVEHRSRSYTAWFGGQPGCRGCVWALRAWRWNIPCARALFHALHPAGVYLICRNWKQIHRGKTFPSYFCLPSSRWAQAEQGRQIPARCAAEGQGTRGCGMCGIEGTGITDAPRVPTGAPRVPTGAPRAPPTSRAGLRRLPRLSCGAGGNFVFSFCCLGGWFSLQNPFSSCASASALLEREVITLSCGSARLQ